MAGLLKKKLFFAASLSVFFQDIIATTLLDLCKEPANELLLIIIVEIVINYKISFILYKSHYMENMKSKIGKVKLFYYYLTNHSPAITEFSIFGGHPNVHFLSLTPSVTVCPQKIVER